MDKTGCREGKRLQFYVCTHHVVPEDSIESCLVVSQYFAFPPVFREEYRDLN